MLLPLGTERPKRRPTQVTYALIALNLAVAIMSALSGAWGEMSPGWYSSLVLARDAVNPLTLVGYAFLHGSLGHLLGNMLFLFVFGPNVEDRFGRLWFLGFYLLGGVASGVAHVMASPSGVVGASGAVAAVTGAFLVLFPLTRTKVLLFFFLIGVFSIPSWWLIAFAIAKDLFATGMLSSSPIAHEAHLGGYAFGIAVAMTLLGTGLLSREPYDLFSMMKQRARRRSFTEVQYQSKREQQRQVKNAMPDEVADVRSEISAAVEAGELENAVRDYRGLLSSHGDERLWTTLSRKNQISIGNALFERQDHVNAAAAYERFIEAYPSDSEAPGVRLMLALVNARYLNDPARAKTLLAECAGQLRTDAEQSLHETLSEEVG